MEKFEKEFQIRSYECDKYGSLRIVTLMNILQDAADLSATSLGFGFDFCIQNLLAWVGTNYHIQISRLPQVHEKIKVQTWPSGENKFMALRDFVIYDEKGVEIIKATSQWVLVDMNRKRPVSLAQYLPDYMYIDERVLGVEFAKLPPLENEEYAKIFEARFDDIDLNRHVNNAIYPLWAAETIPSDFLEKHVPSEIEISYKKECLCGQSVASKAELKDLVSLHSVCCLSEPKELASVQIHWRVR
ncbi:MAG: hypothetical protein IJ870_04930 [Alphaproteobacteria bacterium]|nr:hypothetical protein [Alphaproteobacteria bacterium]